MVELQKIKNQTYFFRIGNETIEASIDANGNIYKYVGGGHKTLTTEIIEMMHSFITTNA